MKFHIEVHNIPQSKQHYPTSGDYWEVGRNDYQFRISAKSKRDFYCYLIHEMVEAFLTRDRGINWEKIDEFDIKSGLYDPGASPDAPYHKEHEFANKIEDMFREELNAK